jgi:hypothetical protein
MNPMVFTIVVTVHEQEIQRQMQRAQRFREAAISPDSSESRSLNRRSLFGRISRILPDKPRLDCESAEADY